MRRPTAVFLLAAFASFASPAVHLMAEVIPPNLSPGSQYQLLFITAGTHDATSSDLAIYDDFVAAQADLNSSLSSRTWHTVLVASAGGTNRFNDNAPATGVPVYNTDGLLLVAGGQPGDLYNASTFLNDPSFDQFGNRSLVGHELTHVVQQQGGKPQAFSVPTPTGPPYSTPWGPGVASDPSDSYRLFALSDPITVPTPEPATLVLLVSAFLVLSGIRILRRRRQSSVV
jgi:hypothetical protein